MKKRIVSFVLVLCLVVSLLPGTAFAAGDTVTYPVEGGSITFDKSTGTVTAADMSITSATIPEVIDGIAVTAISGYAFQGHSQLASVEILANLTELDRYAFSSCTVLESVKLPEGLISIGNRAFYACKNLSDINLPDSITSIDAEAFSGCESLKNIHIPTSMSSIGNKSFAGCTGLTEVTIPVNIQALGEYAFWQCTNLKTVTLSEGLTTIGPMAFRECSSLVNINIPNSVLTIEHDAFNSCSSLVNISIPDSVTELGGAFANCTSLEFFRFPNTIKTIGQANFFNCTSLKSVIIPSTVTKIELRAFDNCDALTDVYYGGTKGEWENITIMNQNSPLESESLVFHYESDGQPDKPPVDPDKPPVVPDDPNKPAKLNVVVNYDKYLSGLPINVPINVKVQNVDTHNSGALTAVLDLSSSNNLLFMRYTSDGQASNIFQIDSLSPNASIEINWPVVASSGQYCNTTFNISIFMNYGQDSEQELYSSNFSVYTDIDTDGDGLPDAWEIYGVDVDGDGAIDLPLNQWGADPNKKDLFIEVDWMDIPAVKNTTKLTSTLLPLSSFQEVADVFEAHDIILHIDAGPGHSVNFPSSAVSGSNKIPYVRDVEIGVNLGADQYDFSKWDNFVAPHFNDIRKPVFRHCMLLDTFISPDGGKNSSGFGRPNDQYFLVSNIFNNSYDDFMRTSTFMHELGHSLGLGHGGQDNDNYKINYLSIMNYSFQIGGIYKGVDAQGNSLPGELNYSEYALRDIDENALNEYQSLDPNTLYNGKCGTYWFKHEWFKWNKYKLGNVSDACDYNWNRTQEKNTYAKDINKDGKKTVLKSYSDWDKLVFKGGQIGNISAKAKSIVNTSSDCLPHGGLTIEEAINSSLFEHVVGCAEFNGPDFIFPSGGEQNLFFEICNLRYRKSDLTFVVESNGVVDKTEIPVKLNEAIDQIVSEQVSVPVKSNIMDGVYLLHYYLIDNETNEKVFERQVDINVETLTDDEIIECKKELAAYSSDDLNRPVINQNVISQAKTVFDKLEKTISGSNPSDPQNPSNPSGGGYYPSTSYSISVPTMPGGKLSVNPSSASAGKQVTITATPDAGYQLNKLTVSDSKGQEIAFTNNGSNQFTFKMPNGKVTIDASFVPIPAWYNPFTDVSEGAWYFDAIKYVNSNGLMNGVGDGRFAPDAGLSRAMLVQILYNKEGRPSVSGYVNSFSDVEPNSWYADAVTWAATKQITLGYDDNRFGPNDYISREQLATMLWRYFGSPSSNYTLRFDDAGQVSDYALDALKWAAEKGILNGYDNKLTPRSYATRAQVAQMLLNYARI